MVNIDDFVRRMTNCVDVPRLLVADAISLRSELAAKDARIQELKDCFSVATARIAELDATWLKVCDQRDALRKELAETKERISCYWNPTAVAWQLEAEKLRKELAEAQATSLADRKRAVDIGNALQTSLGLANKELAEAKRCRDNAEAALEVYDRTFPKKSELELHAALEAANANISDLRRKVSDHEKYIADIEEACNNLSAKCDQEAGDAVDAENALEAANVSLAEAKAALDKLQKAYDESHNENRDLLQFIERMEQEIDHA